MVVSLILATGALAIDRVATWGDNSNNEDGFVFQMCPGTCAPAAGGWKEIARLGPGVRTFTVVSVPEGSVTSYRVGAFNIAGVTFSPVTVDTIPGLPTAPTTITFTPCKTVSVVEIGTGVWQAVCQP